MKALRVCLVSALAVIGVLAAAPGAEAAHHLVKIRQVYPGTASGGEHHEFVVLQLTGADENFVNGTTVTRYSADGTMTSASTFSGNVANGANQATILAATLDATTAFTATADLSLSNVDALSNAGGAVCFTSPGIGPLDCVGWGNISFTPPSPIGTPEPAIPTDSMLERSIGSGCPTFFEGSDDTNNSANNFFATNPPAVGMLRENDSMITETICPTLNVLLGGGVGNGTVTGNGINCPGVCSQQIAEDTDVTLTATPVGAATFANWANCPTPTGMTCELTMGAGNLTVTANFNPPPGTGGGGTTTPTTPPKKKCKKGQKLKKGKCVKKKKRKK